MDPFAGRQPAEPIGDPGWDLFRKGILPVLSPPVHDVAVLVELSQQAGDVARVALKVSVKGDDHFSSGGVETGLQGDGLPFVPDGQLGEGTAS